MLWFKLEVFFTDIPRQIPNITRVAIENNLVLAILQIRKRYNKNFRGLIYTALMENSKDWQR
jgi:hypothetical protein